MSGGLLRRKISLVLRPVSSPWKGGADGSAAGLCGRRKLERQDAALFPVAEGAQNVLFRMIKAVCHVRNADRIACLADGAREKDTPLTVHRWHLLNIHR